MEVKTDDRERIDAELRKVWAAFDDWTEQEQGLARTVWLHAEHPTRGVEVTGTPDKQRADMVSLLRDPNFTMAGGSDFALEIVAAIKGAE